MSSERTSPAGDQTAPRTDGREEVTVANCDREPIHVPGSIQPHGVLLALREPDLLVTHASANAGRIARAAAAPGSPGGSVTPAGLVGMELQRVLDEPSFELIRQGIAACELGPLPCRVGVAAGTSGESYEVLAHRHAGRLVLEFEPAAPVGGGVERLHDRLAAEAARLEQAASVEQLVAVAAAAARRLSGFDKVMVYQFDEEWNGTVVAEEGPAEPGAMGAMDAYLGLRFPASDIPAQARELYRLNPVRLIPDVDYTPAPLFAAEAPGAEAPEAAAPPLDLSYAVLRSVSPVHIEYLKNMRVSASMSVSVVRGGRLWGLIAFHHRTPRFVPHPVRSACVVLARLVSQLLAAAEARREVEYADSVRVVLARLVKHAADREDPADALVECEADLLGLVEAEGAAVCVDGSCRLLGRTPAAEEVTGLAEWLVATDVPVLYTDWLAARYPRAEGFKDRAGGLLAATLPGLYRRCVMWFRPERVRTVTWAGDPNKLVEPGQLRLHPRTSFAAWEQRVGRKSLPWRRAEVEAAASLREALADALLRKAEEAAARAKDQFLAVLSHELRTPLSPVLTAASALEFDDALPAETRELMRVIRRNVELETRLIDDLLDLTRISKGKLVINPETVDVHTLVERTLEVCERELREKGIRVTVAAEAAAHHVEGDPARLQQVLWNILKNAIKFTPPGGGISVRTGNRDGGANGGRVRLEVTDTGAGIDPEVLPHIFNAFEQGGRTMTRRYGGLGLGLAIAKTLVEVHRGRITASSAGKGHGATFTVDLPTVASPAPPAEHTAAAAAPPSERRSKLHILLVEDHADTARVMARLLRHLGYEIKTADSVAAARTLAAAHAFDLVVSDLGLPDGSGNDLMRELRSRHAVRGIALTGWGMEDDVRGSREAGFDRHLTKPVDFQSLKEAIREVVGGDPPQA